MRHYYSHAGLHARGKKISKTIYTIAAWQKYKQISVSTVALPFWLHTATSSCGSAALLPHGL